MKNHRLSRIAGCVICALMAIVPAGCVSSEQFYKEVSVSRDAAYRQWQSRKQRSEDAQVQAAGQLSVQDCLKLAVKNNKMLQRIVQEKEIARGERLKSYSAILPSVGLTSDYMRRDEVASISIPSGPTITMGDVDNYSAGLRVTQPVFAGGSIEAGINAARVFSLLADETVRSAVQDVIYAVEHAYYDVLLDQHLVQISADAVRSAKAHLDSVRQRRTGGVASDFDVLRAEVELSNFEAELIRNRNTINVARANLLKLMGVSQDSAVVLSDELVYVPCEVTMEQAVASAYRSRPDIFGRELDIKYQQELLKIAGSRYWPIVSGYYENMWSKPDPHRSMDIEWGHAWQAGVTVSLPLFDGLAREGQVVQQKARVRQSQIELVDAEETALFELTRAALSIQDAKEFVESQRLNLVRAEEGLRLAEIGYRQGTNTQVEMIDAQAALTTARANYYQAIYSHIIAKLDLQKAMGALTTFEVPGSEERVENDELQPAGEAVSADSVK